MLSTNRQPCPTLVLPQRPSTLPWRLRPALPSDALALRENCLSDWPSERVEQLLRRARRSALQQRGLALAVEMGGDVIGFGQVTLWPRAAEISDVIIAPPWRGRGIGSALVQRLVMVANEMGMDRVEIGVALRNYSALMLYRRLGFGYGRTLDLDLGDGLEPVMYLERQTAVAEPDSTSPDEVSAAV